MTDGHLLLPTSVTNKQDVVSGCEYGAYSKQRSIQQRATGICVS